MQQVDRTQPAWHAAASCRCLVVAINSKLLFAPSVGIVVVSSHQLAPPKKESVQNWPCISEWIQFTRSCCWSCCCHCNCCCEVVEVLPCWLAASTLDYFTVGAFSEAFSRPYNNKAAGISVFPFIRKSTPDTFTHTHTHIHIAFSKATSTTLEISTLSLAANPKPL